MTRRRQTRPETLDCREVARLLQAFLDGEIADPLAVPVADHLQACLTCGMEADTYRWLRAAVAGLARADDPRQLRRLQRFVEALASGEGPVGVHAGNPISS